VFELFVVGDCNCIIFALGADERCDGEVATVMTSELYAHGIASSFSMHMP
jgi:hypothetical protein